MRAIGLGKRKYALLSAKDPRDKIQATSLASDVARKE